MLLPADVSLKSRERDKGLGSDEGAGAAGDMSISSQGSDEPPGAHHACSPYAPTLYPTPV